MYNMVPYGLKVMHIEDDILNVSPIVQNINSYPSEYNNHGEESSMVLLYDQHLCETFLS